jgi:hypothetical protein
MGNLLLRELQSTKQIFRKVKSKENEDLRDNVALLLSRGWTWEITKDRQP